MKNERVCKSGKSVHLTTGAAPRSQSAEGWEYVQGQTALLQQWSPQSLWAADAANGTEKNPATRIAARTPITGIPRIVSGRCWAMDGGYASAPQSKAPGPRSVWQCQWPRAIGAVLTVESRAHEHLVPRRQSLIRPKPRWSSKAGLQRVRRPERQEN